MKCPRCVQVIHRGAGLCPHCGFGIAEMDARHGKDNVSLRRLADVAGLMRSRERGKVQSALDGFCRRFPQLFFAVYTGSAQGGGNLRQFGFWLLNRAAFEDVPVDRPNEAGILLVIDPESKSAVIAPTVPETTVPSVIRLSEIRELLIAGRLLNSVTGPFDSPRVRGTGPPP